MKTRSRCRIGQAMRYSAQMLRRHGRPGTAGEGQAGQRRWAGVPARFGKRNEWARKIKFLFYLRLPLSSSSLLAAVPIISSSVVIPRTPHPASHSPFLLFILSLSQSHSHPHALTPSACVCLPTADCPFRPPTIQTVVEASFFFLAHFSCSLCRPLATIGSSRLCSQF